MTTAIEEIVRLRRRIEELECENHELKRVLRPVDGRFRSLDLTPNEMIVLRAIYDAFPNSASNERLQAALAGSCVDPRREIYVYISKIRRKLRSVGIEINRHDATGYGMPAPSKYKLDGVIAVESIPPRRSRDERIDHACGI